MERNTRIYLNVVALVAMLVFNFLSNAIPFNQLTQQDLADMFPVLLTPETYVFGIWGLIYLLLIGFVIIQALPGYRDSALVEAVGPWFAVSSLFNILWLFAWHYLQVGLSLLIIALFLVTLVVLYRQINQPGLPADLWGKLLVRLPFSVYVAWLSVATLANFNVWLYDLGWLGTTGGAVPFTMLMVAVAFLVALAVFWKQGDFAYPLVFVWALIGVGVRHGSDLVALTLTAWVAAAALLFFMGWLVARKQARAPRRV